MNHPNFFILGAQKAGTTWLATQLARHRDVFFTDPKEPLVLSRKKTVTAEDYAAYCAQYFAGAQDHAWRGEGSTTYLQWTVTIDRVRSLVPGRPRFIVCLRQPLTKAVSFFIHNWRRGRYPAGSDLTFSMDKINLSPYRTSLYADGIARWLAAYPRADFLFLRYDDLKTDPAGFLGRATAFLGITPLTLLWEERINAGLPLVWRDGVLTTAKPGPQGYPRFTRDELQRLQDLMIPDIRRTADLTGLDLSSWMAFPQELDDLPDIGPADSPSPSSPRIEPR